MMLRARLARRGIPTARRPRAGRRRPCARACSIIPATDRRRPASRRRPERRAAEPGAAAEIEHRAELAAAVPACAPSTASSRSSRPAIVEPLQQRLRRTPARAGRTAPHIVAGHRRRRLADAEPRQMQPRAVIVLAVGVARRRERRDRAVAVAQPARGSSPSANQAVAKPGAVSTTCTRISAAAAEIAALEIVQRPLVAPVGDQIAG